MPIDLSDKRWGGYVPWFLRHTDFNGTGNFNLFFERLSQRFFRLFYYNEFKIENTHHYGSLIESKSLQRYRFVYKVEHGNSSLAYSIQHYFDPQSLQHEMESKIGNDLEEKELNKLGRKVTSIGGYKAAHVSNEEFEKFKELERSVGQTRPARAENHLRLISIDRLAVLEIILRQLCPYNSAWFKDLIEDIRRFLAEAQIMLDINEQKCQIELLEELILQKEVIDNLMPRLSSQYPERADEFIRAYHDMIAGKPFDEIFVEAFKSLEELARNISGYSKFEFKDSDLKQYFPNLHNTIHVTMVKLNAHRGDKGGHAKNAPEPHEISNVRLGTCI